MDELVTPANSRSSGGSCGLASIYGFGSRIFWRPFHVSRSPSSQRLPNAAGSTRDVPRKRRQLSGCAGLRPVNDPKQAGAAGLPIVGPARSRFVPMSMDQLLLISDILSFLGVLPGVARSTAPSNVTQLRAFLEFRTWNPRTPLLYQWLPPPRRILNGQAV